MSKRRSDDPVATSGPTASDEPAAPGSPTAPNSSAAPTPREEARRIAYLSHDTARRALFSLADSGIERVPERPFLLMFAAPCVSTQGQAKAAMASGALDFLKPFDKPLDLLVPTAEARSRGSQANLHVWSYGILERSLWKANDSVLVSDPGFVVLQLACSRRPTKLSRGAAARESREESRIRAELGLPEQDFAERDLLAWVGISQQVDAVVAACEFSSTYRPPHPGSPTTAFGREPLASRAEMRGFLRRMPASAGITRARRALDLAYDRSGSPMETALALILTLPVDMGGYGVPRPGLNRPISLLPGQRELSSMSEITPDLCWEEAKVAIEYDGDDFHPADSPEKLSSDNERQNALTSLGYRVIRVRYPQVASPQRMDLLARQLASLLGIPLDRPSDLQLIRRQKLILKLTRP